MTESQWRVCEDPAPMFEILGKEVSSRKCRLFICACCRRGIDNIRSAIYQYGLDVAEAYADGAAGDDERDAAYQETTFRKRKNWPQMNIEAMVHGALAPDDELAPLNVRSRISNPRSRAFQAAVVRCLFGNPFRPIAFSAAWRTDATVSLARRMYAARDFFAAPLLADALHAAGCENADIVDHCRGPGPHARGCWVVDLILSKDR